MREYAFPLAGRARPVYVPDTAADLDTFRDWFDEANRRAPIGFDTETTGLDIYSTGYRLRTMQFGTRDEAFVLQVDNDPRMLRHGMRALQQADKLIIHNAPFDWLVCDQHVPGITLESLAPKTVDTRVLCHLLDPRKPQEGGTGTGLKPASAHYIDADAPDTQAGLHAVFRTYGLTKETGWAGIDINDPTYLAYGGGDVILVSELLPILEERLRQRGIRPALVQYEHEVARICSVMQRRGLVVDQDYARELDGKLEREAEKYTAIAAELGVANVNSTDQIAQALIAQGVKLTAKTDGGAWKVDKNVINPLAGLTVKGEVVEDVPINPLAEAVYHAKRAGKWRNTYVERFLTRADANGRIHPSINTMAARTARMSITGDLAAQTLPSSDWMIRRAILADEGELWFSVDFKAVEMRVLAALADVRLMKEAIAAGRDLHDFTTELVYGNAFTKKERKTCKGVGLSKVYGGGAYTTSLQTGVPIADIQHAMGAYDRVYPEIKRTSKRWQREARAQGFVTVTCTGRHLPLDADRAYAVVNYQCQSAARDVLGQGLIAIEEAGLLPYLRLPIHDEVAGSAPKADAEEIVRAIERCMTMSLGGVPIDAEGEVGGRSWGSLYGATV